jgi:methyl-accepting chemotaxis protein
MIASQTHDVAVDTDTIAKLVVSDADAKEFIGKDTVKAKIMEKHQTSAPTQTIKSEAQKPITSKVELKDKIKPIQADKSNDEEWASF